MKITVGKLKRLVREAASAKSASDGFAAAMADEIEATVQRFKQRLIAVAEELERDETWGEWISSADFEWNDELESKLTRALSDVVDDVSTQIVADRMRGAEDRASSPDSLSYGAYQSARSARDSWDELAKLRKQRRVS